MFRWIWVVQLCHSTIIVIQGTIYFSLFNLFLGRDFKTTNISDLKWQLPFSGINRFYVNDHGGCTKASSCDFIIFDLRIIALVFFHGLLLHLSIKRTFPCSHWVLWLFYHVLFSAIGRSVVLIHFYLLQLPTVLRVHHCREDNVRNWC